MTTRLYRRSVDQMMAFVFAADHLTEFTRLHGRVKFPFNIYATKGFTHGLSCEALSLIYAQPIGPASPEDWEQCFRRVLIVCVHSSYHFVVSFVLGNQLHFAFAGVVFLWHCLGGVAKPYGTLPEASACNVSKI